MNQKAQGLSINTIIIAAIALIVLVVLVAIFTGRLGLFSKGLGEVTNCDQICKARGYGTSNPNEIAGSTNPTFGDPLTGARDSDGNQCYCKK